MLALVGKNHRQIGVLAVVEIAQAERDVFFLAEIDLVALEGARRFLKGQLLDDAAHFFKYVPIAILDHAADLVGGRLHAGRPLANIYAAGLYAL